MPLSPGSRLGAYEVEGLLGAGGMGQVWRARDTRLGRDVAIKALPEALSREPDRLARFEREAKLLASLNHPNIAGIYGLEEEDRRRYLVLEFVEGETLEDRLRRGVLPVDESLEVAAQVAGALEAAHESGVVHRDLKPGNVMLTPGGTAKVLDFGLAKGAEAASSASGLSQSPTLTQLATQDGVILGTAAYMSPEQARGRRVDRRTDIWSFGCLLYECLTGQQAFEGDTVSDLIARILEREPAWNALPERLPPRVRELLRRCLTKDPALRLRDIGEARIVLSHIDAESDATADPAPARGGRRGSPWAWGVTGAVIVAAVALLAIGSGREGSRVPLWLSVVVPPDQRVDAGPEFNLLAIAPDGLSVAYVARTQGAFQLHIRRLDDRSETVLPGTEGARDPFFSPDGEWVGFMAGDKLKKVSIHGGTPVVLADAAGDRGATWAPDGSIVYTPDFESPLMRIPEAGGTPALLTTLDSTRAERSHRWPDAIAGSEWIVFTVGTKASPGGYDESDIDVVSLRTGERRTVARGSFARFAPGHRLVVGRSGSLYARSVNPADPRAGEGMRPVLNGVLGRPTSGAVFFDVAENGTLAYVPGATGAGEARLGWVDMSGRVTPLPVDPLDFNRLEISPDGNRALLEVGPGSGNAADIWLLDLRDFTLSRMTFGGRGYNPLWHPDGKRFVWSAPPQGSLMIRTLDGSDSARTVVMLDQLAMLESITPDGSEVLFSQYGSVDSDVWGVPLKGDPTPRVSVQGPLSQGDGVVSPDLRWIAYSSNETGAEEIYVRPWRRSGSRSQISKDGGGLPFWGPTGDTLFYYSRGGMYRVPLAVRENAVRAGTAERLFDVDVTIESSRKEIALHPSGKKFLIKLRDTANERREIGIVPGWAASLGRKP